MTETTNDDNVIIVTESSSSLPTVSKPTSKLQTEDNATNTATTTTTITVVSDDEEVEEVNIKKKNRIRKEGHVADDSFLTIEESSSKEEDEDKDEEEKKVEENDTKEEEEIIQEEEGVEDPRDEEEESDVSESSKCIDDDDIIEAPHESKDGETETGAGANNEHENNKKDIEKDDDASSIPSATCSVGKDETDKKDIAIVTPSKEEQVVHDNDGMSLPDPSSDCTPSTHAFQKEPNVVSPSATSTSVSTSSPAEEKYQEKDSFEDHEEEAKPFDEESLSPSAKIRLQEHKEKEKMSQQQSQLPIQGKTENKNEENKTESTDDEDKIDTSENTSEAVVISDSKKDDENAVPAEITITLKEKKKQVVAQKEEEKKNEEEEEAQHVPTAYIQQQLNEEEKDEKQARKQLEASEMVVGNEAMQQRERRQQQMSHSTIRKEHEEVAEVRPSQILNRLKKKKKAKAVRAAAAADSQPPEKIRAQVVSNATDLRDFQEQKSKRISKKKSRKKRALEEDDGLEPPPLTVINIPSTKDELMGSLSEQQNDNKGTHNHCEKESKIQDDDEDIPWDERQLEQKHTSEMNAYQFLLDAFRTTTDPRIIKRISNVSDQTLLKFLKWKPDAKRSYRRMKDFMNLPSRNTGYFGIPSKPLLVSRDMDLYRLLEYDLFAWTAPPPMTSSAHTMIHSNSVCTVGGVCVGDSPPPILLTRIGNLPNDNEDPLNICRAALYVVDRLLERSDVRDHGLIVLHDMTNVSIRTIKVLSDLLYNTIGCFPLKIRKMYVYNCPWYISSTGAITRRFSEKLNDRTVFVGGVLELKETLMNDWGTVSAGGNIFQKRENKRLWKIIDGKVESVPKEESVGGGSWVSKQYERELVGDDFTSLYDCFIRQRKQTRYKKPDSLEQKREENERYSGKQFHSTAPRRRDYEYIPN